MSIRLRLTLWYSTILAVTLLAFGVALYFVSSYTLLKDKKNEMRQLGRDVESQTSFVGIQWGDAFIYKPVLPSLDQFKYPGYFLQTRNVDGRFIGSTVNNRELPFTYDEAQMEAGESVFYTETLNGSKYLVLNKPIYMDITRAADSKMVGILQVAVNINGIQKNLDTLKLALMVLSLMVLVLAASLGMYLARKALKPIENVISAAAQIGNGADLGMRIQYEGPKDEIGLLTGTINSMLERIQGAYKELEESDRAQRRFVSDASHELRTPLTTIRGNVDLLEKMWRQGGEAGSSAVEVQEKVAMSMEAMHDISDEAARMSRLVNDLLALARADAGQQMVKEPVMIRDIVEEAARKAQHLPRKAQWQVEDLSALNGIGVKGSKDHLQQMLFIFIENAFKYTEQGHVRLDAVMEENQVGIRVSDTGIGMDKEEIPHIFERFYRADVSRGVTSGTGLGLSIAKWIIDEHGGSIEVTTRKGSGSTFIIWLPIFFHELRE